MNQGFLEFLISFVMIVAASQRSGFESRFALKCSGLSPLSVRINCTYLFVFFLFFFFVSFFSIPSLNKGN